MKNKKLITLILASMAIGALVGCKSNQSNSGESSGSPSSTEPPSSESGPGSSGGEELPAEYSLMKYWAGNPAEEVYDVNDTGANTVITYTDATGEESGGWEYVARPFAYDAAVISQFKEYKKFSFTAKLEKSSGSDIVMVKAQGSATFEKRIQITSEEQTFEFSTAFISDWTGMESLLFFVNRNIKESGNGVLTLTRFVLSKEVVDPAYDISGSMPDVPQDWNYYDGEESLKVMYSWGYNQQGEIATEKVDGGFKFTYGGDVKKTEAWGFVSAKIKNASETKLMKDSGYKRIVYQLQGTAGQTAILKFEARVAPITVKAAKELSIEMTGELQTFEMDITGVIPNAEADSYFPLIMPAAGQTGDIPAGEIILKDCYLDKTAVVIPEEKNEALYPVIWMDKVAFADPCYSTILDGHTLTVNYTKEASGWESMQFKVQETDEWYANGEEAKNYNRVVAHIKANVNVKVLLKPFDEGSLEHWFTLETGVEQDVDFTVAKDKVDLTKPLVVFICAGDGEQATSGQVLIEGLRLVRESVNVGYKDDVRLNKVHSANAEITTSLNDDKDLVADFAFEKVDYHMIEMLVSTEDNAAHNRVIGTVTSTVNTSLLLKPADASANEKKYELTAGEPCVIEYDFTTKLNDHWGAKFIMFLSYEAGNALTGKVTFKDLALTIFDPEKISEDPNPVNMGAVYINNWSFASNCYTLKKAVNGTKVIFEGKGEGWENMQASLVKTENWFNLADYTRVTAKLTSTVNMHIIIKPYDNGAAERGYDLVAGTPLEVDYTFDPTGLDFAKNLIFFVGTGGMQAGELLIERLALSNPKTNLEAADGNIYLTQPYFALEGTYAVTSGEQGMVINYNKPAGQEWEGIQIFASARDLDAYKVLHYELTSVKAVHVKFKIDGPNEEKEIEVPVGESSGKIAFTNHIDAKWNKILIFIAYDAGDDLAGSLNFSKLYFAAE